MRKVRREKNTVYHFTLLEKKRKTAEMPLRVGFELHNHKASVNLNIPFLLRFAAYSTFLAESKNKNVYGIQHIYDFHWGKFLRTGFDSYKGEFALLLPLLKIWLQSDLLSNEFRQFRKFSIVVFLLKIKRNEITFRAGILTFRIGIRIAAD